MLQRRGGEEGEGGRWREKEGGREGDGGEREYKLNDYSMQKMQAHERLRPAQEVVSSGPVADKLTCSH